MDGWILLLWMRLTSPALNLKFPPREANLTELKNFWFGTFGTTGPFFSIVKFIFTDS